MPEGEATPAAAPEAQGAPAPQAQTPPGDATGTNGGEEAKPQFTQAQLDAIVRDRLDRQKKANESAAAKAAEEAEANKLREQSEWQKLAESHEAKVKDLEPRVTQAEADRDQLREIVAAMLEAETKDWPKEVRDILPPAEADVLARHAAVQSHRPLAAKLAQANPTPGNGPNPRPNGAATDTQKAAEQMREFARSRI